MPGGDMRQQQEPISFLPVFSSPRVFCGPSKLQYGSSLGPEQVEEEEEEEARALHHGNDDIDIASSSDLTPFVGWLLDMAARSPNLGIRFEAATMMGLLVAHTEPVSERALFGSLLWYGRLASLLQEAAGDTAGMGVQLQAIRLVHLLLHCPVLLRIFCSALDTSLGGCWCEVRNQGEARSAEGARTQVPSLEIQGKGDSCKVVLDGISSCLDCSGSSLQAYALRRDAIRVLTFLASSGDAAIRILLHLPMKLEPSNVPLKESNISTDGGNGIQSENAQQEPGSRKHSAGTGDIPVETATAAPAVFTGERYCFDIPGKLLSLLARELKAEEDEALADNSPVERTVGCEEDRACLICEAVTLFSKLLCNPLHSREVLNWIVTSKETTLLILGVIDQLIRRGSRPSSSTDLVELARVLQKKVVPELTPL